jgi:DNA primase
LALGQDNSETNYTRLLDVKARLSSLDGTEALIEGFGASSGRPARPMQVFIPAPERQASS